MRSLQRQPLSIVIPTLNEVDNIERLVKRIHFSLSKHKINYEIIFIDDHSTDGTSEIIKILNEQHPNVRVLQKIGKAGKAYSLLEGFTYAKYELVCMIDGDLQYPPEAIVPMYDLLVQQNADIVITERIDSKTSYLRKLQSKLFNLFFTRILFGINYDSQSGLKLFKKNILNTISLYPSPWSFDLEFLVRSLEQQYKVVSHKIIFSERTDGISKVNTIGTAIELAKASVALRLSSSYRAIKKGYDISKRTALTFPVSREPTFISNRKANNTFLPILLIGIFIGSMVPTQPTQALSLPEATKEITHKISDVTNFLNPTTTSPVQTNPIVQAPTPPVVNTPIINPQSPTNTTTPQPSTSNSTNTAVDQQSQNSSWIQSGSASTNSRASTSPWPTSATSTGTSPTSFIYPRVIGQPNDPYAVKETGVSSTFTRATFIGLITGVVLLVVGLNINAFRSLLIRIFALPQSTRNEA